MDGQLTQHTQNRIHPHFQGGPAHHNHFPHQHSGHDHHQPPSGHPMKPQDPNAWKRTKNWKLIEDPTLTKGVAQKVYRVEGVIVGVSISNKTSSKHFFMPRTNFFSPYKSRNIN